MASSVAKPDEDPALRKTRCFWAPPCYSPTAHMRLFGWGKTSEEGPADVTLSGRRPKLVAFRTGTTCGVVGCSNTQGYRCSYRDRTGARCDWWCKDHSVILNGRAWCQRHANSVKWLHSREGSIYEIHHVADLHDRTPNLVGILVDELNAEVTAHLQTCFRHQNDVRIVTDGNVRALKVPKGSVRRTASGPEVLSQGYDTTWGRGWGVYSHAGYVARVVLAATTSEPPMVHVYINGHVVLSRVPDWISNRAKGSNEVNDHRNFNSAVLDAIRRSRIVEHEDS